MSNDLSFGCPFCPFETSDVKKLEWHSNEHLDKEEYSKLRENFMEEDKFEHAEQRENSMEDDDQLEDDKLSENSFEEDDNEPPAKRGRFGGTFKICDYRRSHTDKTVCEEPYTAQKNLYELQAGSVRYRWNRSCFNTWLKENVPEAKVYSKETLKKRVKLVVDESKKFLMSKKESSATGMGKMKKNIDPKLHSERKESFIEPSTKEEKEMAEMGSMFAHLKKEIEETPIKQKSKKVSPQVEAKARQLDEMLEGDDEHEDEDEKKKIERGTLKGLPYDMYEKSQQHRLKSVQNHYESRKEIKENKEPTKPAKKEDLESAVMDLCKATVERMNINQAANPQPAFSPCMPYGYSYPGLMGASLPMGMAAAPMFPPTQHMGMPPANMIRPAMSFQPPSTPEHNNSAKSVVAEGFSIENTLPEAPISGRGRSSSELAGASLTGEGGPSSERDPETAGNSQIEEKEPSSAGFAPPKQRASVIGITGQVSDQAPLAKPTPAGGRKSVISSALQSSDRAPADINSTAPMAYGVPYMRSHVSQQSQAGQMVHSDMITAQAGATSPQMSAQMMPPQMMAPPLVVLLAQQQMIQQQIVQQMGQMQMGQMGQPQIGHQHIGQPQMIQQQIVQQIGQPQIGQPQIGQPQMSQPQMIQPQIGQPQIGQPQMSQPQMIQPQIGQPQNGPQQIVSMMAQQQGYPQTFQRSVSPMMMPGPSNSSVPNGMGPMPSKNKENMKSDEFNDESY